jgi:hypothetical protein
MRWRTSAAILIGLLLPVPLLVLLGGAWGWGLRPQRDEELTPVLSWEQQRSLVTFGRACQTSEDCESPLACLQDTRRVVGPRCVASECLTDLQCKEGFVCQVVTSRGQGKRVRVCVVEDGLRKEGEACSHLPNTREDACGKGLVCRGWCGRSCRMEEPASCPEGFYCDVGPAGSSCLPTCAGRTCPEGQQCAHFQGGTSVCAVIRGPNCQQTPCPEGQQCRVTYSPQRIGEVGMECVAPCDEEATACPEGTLCFDRACRRPCQRGMPDACGPAEQCVYYPVEKLWLCKPHSPARATSPAPP